MILALIMISSFCVAVQASAVAASFSRHKAPAVRWVESFVEICVLIYSLILALMISRINTNMKESLILSAGYIYLRYIILLIAVVLVLIVGILRKKPLYFDIILMMILTLPYTEVLSGHFFPLIYAFVLPFFMVRAIYIFISFRRAIRKEVSALSVKEAMDALHTGLLYSGADGTIYLINRRMQELQIALTGKVWRNGKDFRDAVLNGNTLIKSELDNEKVFILPDGTACLFVGHEIEISKKKYMQVSACDVSERWKLTGELKRRENELKKRHDELTNTLRSLDEIHRKEELLKLKSKVHDTMAQRLTVLMRIFRAEISIDEVDLVSYADNMLSEVSASDFEDESSMELLCKIYEDIGVNLTIDGYVPKSPEYLSFYIGFVRECTINAVRHGLATEVSVTCILTENEISVSVTNNGTLPIYTIKEGGGITELRRRLNKLGGRLHIEARTQFKITAYISVVTGGRFENDK